MRVVVCAYGEVGHGCLEELLDLDAEVALVLTHEDSPTERIWFSSVRDLALSSGIQTLTPPEVNTAEVCRAVREAAPDVLFSFYFRQMMGPELLSSPSMAAVNLHGSLLPRYRGRCPVNWVLIKGETETGVTLHHMDEKPDHGDVIGQRAVGITRSDTAESLTRKLATEGRVLLRELWPAFLRRELPGYGQDHAGASYFGGRRPADGHIDWSRPAEEIRNLVRAVTDPWPGAFSFLSGRQLLVWAAETRPVLVGRLPGEVVIDGQGSPLVATGEGALELLDVTWEGGSRRGGRDWARAESIGDGIRFDEPRREAAGGGG